MQGATNITQRFDVGAYAMDAVMTLALALNETLPARFNGTLTENSQLNMTRLKTAIQGSMFTGASVSYFFHNCYALDSDSKSIINF